MAYCLHLMASPYCCLRAPSKSPSFMNVKPSSLSMLLFPFVLKKPAHMARCTQCYSSFFLTSPGLCVLSLLSLKSLLLFSHCHLGEISFLYYLGFCSFVPFVPFCSCVMSCLPVCFWGVYLLVLCRTGVTVCSLLTLN